MNQVIKTALNKLIQDETFRTELEGLLDEVNRAAKDPALISRAAEEAPTPAEPASAFADVKDELLADKGFLKALMDELMAMNSADTERAAKVGELGTQIEQLLNTVKELTATVTEHDKVLTDLAEKVVVRESEAPRTVRARTIVKDPATTEKVEPNLSDRAATVLARMKAGPNAA